MSSPAAQPNSERESLLQLLRRTEVLYLATLENVSPVQAAFKAGPQRWSICEIAEHVAATEEFLHELATAASPSTEESDPRMDDRIHRFAADRGRAFAAPKGVCPCGRFGSVVEASAAFRGARQKTIEYVQQTQADLRRRRVMHPAAGSIDVYQNLLIGAYHPERHAKQIEEIKSDEAYPT
jgi:DinB superfamily